jgi:hypothetical protein
MRIRNTACYPNWEEIDMTCRVLSKSEIKPQFLPEFVIKTGGHEELISNSVGIVYTGLLPKEIRSGQ